MELDLGKLFIGGISWDTNEDRLKEYFSKYGEVVESVIMRDRATGRARGFGFVVFADPSVAERVIMDKHLIDGRMVEAKKAVPRDDQHTLSRNSPCIHGSPAPGRTKKIFVGGLASTVTESDFKNYFEQFGNITDVVVMYDHNTQRPRGFGFITYDSEESVELVLHKTFHELNGKMVEVKKAIPKELSPVPNRSPLLGYNNYGVSRAANFLNSYAQGYNINPLGSIGMRMDGRYSPLTGSRPGLLPFAATSYGNMNLDPGLGSSYGGNTNFGNNSNPVGYGRGINPYYNNANRYNTPIGYNSARNDSILSPTSRNVWGNGAFSTPTNPPSPGPYLGSGNASLGVSIGSANWSPLPRLSFGENNYSLGAVRNSPSGVAPSSSLVGSGGGYEWSYADLYRHGTVYNDSTWQSSATPELDGSGPLSYGISNLDSDVKSSEGFIGGYSTTGRQSTRGIVT